MKQFSFTVTDDTARKLDEIKRKLMIANNADAIEQLVDNVHAQLFSKEAK
jgi:predicted transcriptional regulator